MWFSLGDHLLLTRRGLACLRILRQDPRFYSVYARGRAFLLSFLLRLLLLLLSPRLLLQRCYRLPLLLRSAPDLPLIGGHYTVAAGVAGPYG